jgi:hypothetical protein
MIKNENNNEKQHDFNGTCATVNGNFEITRPTNPNAAFWARK